MRTLLPWCAWVSVALLTLAGLVYLCLIQPHVGPPADVNPEAARQQQSALDEYAEDVARRSEARQRLLHEVIAGRLTLAAAAAQFQELDEASATFHWDHFRQVMPGDSDEEKQCHAVIRHVRNLLAKDPDRQRAVTARLRKELLALYHRDAEVASRELPENLAGECRR